YPRLRYHFHFRNEHSLFEGTNDHGRMVFGVHVYRSETRREVGFDSISMLFSPHTVDSSYDHTGSGELDGIKNIAGGWNTTGHASRILRMDLHSLRLFSSLSGDSGTSKRGPRLPVVFSQQALSVLAKFAEYPDRLSAAVGAAVSTVMWDETAAQKLGIIARRTHFPASVQELIVSGPHYFVGTPLNKTPRRVCVANSHYDCLDLGALPDGYLPRSNYTPACTPEAYLTRSPRVSWGDKSDRWPNSQGAAGREPTSHYYRFVCREMLGQSGERTLVPAVLPPGVGHINTCISYAFDQLDLLLDLYAMTISLPLDFLIKSSGMGHATTALLGQLPLVTRGNVARARLHRRALRLTCLTTHYADLWNELAPSLITGPAAQSWTRSSALRTELGRRQSLIEIDVLVAMVLGLTCEELCAIYRIQFPVLRQNENDTWYDANDRIIFTARKGVAGVGFDRKTWNEVSRATSDALVRDLDPDANPAKLPDGVRIDNDTIIRTVEDDTIQDYRTAYGRFTKDGVTYDCPCPDHPDPIEGPVTRDITYTPPFTKCDREADYRTAWAEFRRGKD
ncbi:MAG: hypothetical protein HN396_18230, partial [Gemmatimonadales bacterium]|nr:hypothetical protein [Gemmatimonadales bacterium]